MLQKHRAWKIYTDLSPFPPSHLGLSLAKWNWKPAGKPGDAPAEASLLDQEQGR